MIKILITGGRFKWGLTDSFSRAFQKLGCEVSIFDNEKLYKKQLSFLKNKYTHRLFWKLFSIPLQNEFIRTVGKEKPDLVLVLKGWYFKPETLKKIRKGNPQIKLFCFNTDSPFNTWDFGNSNDWIRKSISLYDVYFIWGKFLIEKLKKAGAKRVEYLPFAYDSDLRYPVKVSKKERKFYGSDIAFIGTWSKEREWWLNHLLGYDLAIWGGFWQKANDKLRKKLRKEEFIGEGFSKVCNSSKIIVDILRRQMVPAHSVKTFEIPVCKGFFLCNKGGELSDFFEEGKEIVTFNNPEEMIDKINFYLNKEGLRKKITEAAYQKVQGHSCLTRAKKILEIYKTIRE